MDVLFWISAAWMVFASVFFSFRLYQWGYERADNHFRSKYLRIILENMDRIERAAEV